MTTALAFNDVTFSPIQHLGSLWIRAVELAHALGYGSEKNVSIIYARHKDEFPNNMSVVINLNTTGTPAMSRIFSLRGCHLIAMFARTPVAKSFRRWVLDVLDELNAEGAQAAEPAGNDPITTIAQREPLRAQVRRWKALARTSYPACWKELSAVFGLGSITQLPASKLPDALAFVQEKIDSLKMQQGAVPPPATQGTLSQGTLVPVTQLAPIDRKENFTASVVDKSLRGALEKLDNAFVHCQFMDNATAPKGSVSRSLYIAAMCNIDAAGAILRAMLAEAKDKHQ